MMAYVLLSIRERSQDENRGCIVKTQMRRKPQLHRTEAQSSWRGGGEAAEDGFCDHTGEIR